MADTLTDEVAESYSKVVDGWTYITNAAEFRLLAQQCQSPDVEEKKIRLACDIEYPSILYRNKPEYYIKYFRGTFDGMGCTIKKFRFRTTEQDQQDNVGFIQELKGTDSKVCNLRFDDCDIDAENECTLAVVVSKITANKADLNNILIKRGSILARQNGIFGCLAGSINSRTTISHCAIDSLDVSRVGDNQLESNPVGIFAHSMVDGGDVTTCSIHNCYMASTPLKSSLYAKFSIITTYTVQEIDQGKFRHSNCFWDNTSFVRSVSTNDFFTNDKDGNRLINVTTLEQLKSGNNVLNDADGWMCQKDSLPKPVGLFYWNPKKSYSNIRVGTYGSSNVLMGEVTPVDYCHYIDPAQLKLTAINSAGATDYVLDDYLSNDIGVESAIVTLGENVLYGIDMNTLQLPGEVTAIEGTAFPHNVSQAFVSHGNWRFAGNMLYLITNDIKRLVTTVGDDEEMTIDCRYCTSIMDEAFKGHTNLRRLYVNTWFPTSATTFTPVELLGDNVFGENADELEVYVKDGTDQLIIGTNIDTGYKKMDCGWDKFYSESQDVPNRLFRYFPVNRNPAKLSTIMIGYPVKLPSDCKAWVATGIDGTNLVLKRVKGNILPALLPVLLSYEETSGVMHLSPYEGKDAPSATLYEGSIFKGSIDPAGHKMDDSEMMTNFLTLSRAAGSTNWSTVAFRPFHPVDDIIPPYIAYFSIQDNQQAKLSMVFDGDYELPDTDGISDIVERGVGASAPVYNLSGQRVGSNYKGLIIKNGRKYIAK